MNVIIFGATGMVGQGVLGECLLDVGVERVLAVGRRATGRTHAKRRDLVVADLTDYGPVAAELAPRAVLENADIDAAADALAGLVAEPDAAQAQRVGDYRE